MISLEDARSVILDACEELGVETRSVGEALGHLLAEPVRANEDIPAFANSAMDGYALRSVDTSPAPARLKVIDTVLAGDGREVEVGPGEAVRIMTGAPLPLHSDAVCMVELTTTDVSGTWVTVGVEVERGTSVRHPGEDIRSGTEVFGPRTQITPAHVGVLSSLGIESVRVQRRPVVGVISTGDELAVGPGPLRRGQLRDGNRPMLLSLLARSHFEAVDLGVAPDDVSTLSQKVRDACSHCDALVTSGGVSVGDADVVRMALAEMCGEGLRWMQVAIRPAKPLAFGRVDGTPILGLPGNPVSSAVSFELFARPALNKMAGSRHPVRPSIEARAVVAMRREVDGRLHLVRVVAEVDAAGALWVRPSGGQHSHQLRAMADANALALLPDGQGVEAQQAVQVLVLDPDRVVCNAELGLPRRPNPEAAG
ncbi:MAG: molybdopterin molybdotransferase MoeA [Acidimicrobiales bacterium]